MDGIPVLHVLGLPDVVILTVILETLWLVFAIVILVGLLLHDLEGHNRHDGLISRSDDHSSKIALVRRLIAVFVAVLAIVILIIFPSVIFIPLFVFSRIFVFGFVIRVFGFVFAAIFALRGNIIFIIPDELWILFRILTRLMDLTIHGDDSWIQRLYLHGL